MIQDINIINIIQKFCVFLRNFEKIAQSKQELKMSTFPLSFTSFHNLDTTPDEAGDRFKVVEC